MRRQGCYDSQSFLDDPTGTNHSLSDNWNPTMSEETPMEAAALPPVHGAAPDEEAAGSNSGDRDAAGNGTGDDHGAEAVEEGAEEVEEAAQEPVGIGTSNDQGAGTGHGAAEHAQGDAGTAKEELVVGLKDSAAVAAADDADDDDVVALEELDNSEAIRLRDPDLFSEEPLVPRPPLKFDEETGLVTKDECHWDQGNHMHVVAPVCCHFGHQEFCQGICKSCWPEPKASLEKEKCGPAALGRACTMKCHAEAAFKEARKSHEEAIAAAKAAAAKAKSTKAPKETEKTDKELAKGIIFTQLEPKMIAQLKKLGFDEAGRLPNSGKMKTMKTKKIFAPMANREDKGCGSVLPAKEVPQVQIGCGHRGSDKPRHGTNSHLSRLHCTNHKCSSCPKGELTKDNVKWVTILEWRVNFEDLLDDDGEVIGQKGTARGDCVCPHHSHGKIPSRNGMARHRLEPMVFDEDFILQGVHDEFVKCVKENHKSADDPPPGNLVTNHIKGSDVHPHDHRLQEQMPSCRTECKPLINPTKHREAMLRFQTKFMNDFGLAEEFSHRHFSTRILVSKSSREMFLPTWPVEPSHLPHLHFDSAMALMDGSQRVKGEIPSANEDGIAPDPIPQPHHCDIAPVSLNQITGLLQPVGHQMMERDPRLKKVALSLGLRQGTKGDDKGMFHLTKKLKAEQQDTTCSVDENPFLKAANLFLPGSVIFPLEDHRRLRFPEGESETTVDLERGKCMCFPGCLTHCGDTCRTDKVPPWHIAVHVCLNSIFHPRIPNTFSHNYQAIAKFQPDHVNSFMSDEQGKALAKANSDILQLCSKTLLGHKPLEVGLRHARALTKSTVKLVEKAEELKANPPPVGPQDFEEEDDEDNDKSTDDDCAPPVAMLDAPIMISGKRVRKRKPEDNTGYVPKKAPKKAKVKETKEAAAHGAASAEENKQEQEEEAVPDGEKKKKAKPTKKKEQEEEAVPDGEKKKKAKPTTKSPTSKSGGRGGGSRGRGKGGRGGSGRGAKGATSQKN